MTTLVHDNPDLNRYEVFEGGELAGFAEYTRSARTISIKHTEVDDRFEGRGLGSALARGVLDGARDDGLSVLPYCPFTASYIRGHLDDYVYLVPQEQRAKFDL